MRLTTAEADALKDILPPSTAMKVHKDIKRKISLRMVYLILKGQAEDNHGVIAIAMKYADQAKKVENKAKNQLKKIIASPTA